MSRIGLSFPDGLEERDVYGRLLCHVLLEDGSSTSTGPPSTTTSSSGSSCCGPATVPRITIAAAEGGKRAVAVKNAKKGQNAEDIARNIRVSVGSVEDISRNIRVSGEDIARKKPASGGDAEERDEKAVVN